MEFLDAIKGYIIKRNKQNAKQHMLIRLETNSLADTKLNNDIADLHSVAKEEGVMLGLYYGIKLIKNLEKL